MILVAGDQKSEDDGIDINATIISSAQWRKFHFILHFFPRPQNLFYYYSASSSSPSSAARAYATISILPFISVDCSIEMSLIRFLLDYLMTNINKFGSKIKNTPQVFPNRFYE